MNATENTHQPEGTNTNRRFFLTSALIAAPLLIALVALGCGEEKEKATANLATTDTAAPVGTGAPLAGAATTVQPASAVATPRDDDSATDQTLPPDIVAAGPESIVAPGSVVTVAATGSTDVTSVLLTDRAGQKTPFTYDSESNLWKASYRVPIRSTGSKLALAVTATTEANRWKRVWVFLRLKDEVVPTPTWA